MRECAQAGASGVRPSRFAPEGALHEWMVTERCPLPALNPQPALEGQAPAPGRAMLPGAGAPSPAPLAVIPSRQE